MKKLSFLLFLVLFFSCKNETTTSSTQNKTSISKPQYLKIAGQTMGTTYHITYQHDFGKNFKKEVDSILVEINQAVSTYIPDSEISKFNQNKKVNFSKNNHFQNVFLAARKIFETTEGYFDPTVMPLVNYWGFGYTEKKAVTKVDSLQVNALLGNVGLEKINSFATEMVDGKSKEVFFPKKINDKVQLDFSAIAKGYAVDVVADFFQKQKIKNYLVEIGGELRTHGKNPKGKRWTTAINTPKINARLTDFEAIISVDNKAVATSGNYRNFHEMNGKWYGHEINPKTGFPEKSNLLSVTVMAEDCMTADAYATAMMVMGLEKSKALADRLKNIDAFFIFANEAGELETVFTEGFEGVVE
ncbi:MAG TPA: FAD:protein FMN transferase [Phaeodactylibacter sp.]|nr:FAD:protein FMN transferase [Phaeodactylibacter sp.]